MAIIAAAVWWQVVEGVPAYKTHNSSWYGRVQLMVDDLWDEPPPEVNADQLAAYTTRVKLPQLDQDSDPGWNLQVGFWICWTACFSRANSKPEMTWPVTYSHICLQNVAPFSCMGSGAG